MVFADARYLWVVGPLYLVVVVAWLVMRVLESDGKARLGGALAYSRAGLLRTLPASYAPYLRRGVEALRLVTLLLLVVALLRPIDGNAQAPLTSQGIDIVLALDVSGSMRALDLDTSTPVALRKTRLDVVKDVVAEFIPKRPSDQLGVVVFGLDAFVQAPLTLDHDMLLALLEDVELGMAGDGTAIGLGLMAALKRLEHSKAKSKVVILLTDGVNNAGDVTPKRAAEVAQALGVRVYTIGAGTRGRAPYIVSSPIFGKSVQEEEVHIDEASLTAIAQETGGAYFRAVDQAALLAIYEKIDALEKTVVETRFFGELKDRFGPLVLWAIGLLLLEVALLGTRFARVP